MDTKFEFRVERDLKKEEKEIELIEKNISRINDKLLDKVPSRFSIRDVINAVFGSLIMGITFTLKGGTIMTAVNLHPCNIVVIVAATLLVLIAEIYFISYTRVRDKSSRRLGQFLTKRLFSLYGITLSVSFMLVYLFNLQNNYLVITFNDVLKLVILVSFPCAIGAAVPSLLKKY
ncbi:DUF2391 family protein [Candidatus Woesearchaeota archaeon]|nr:DUF2391 family protein [Candidatus Woesearchaeota archaeon]